MINGNNSAMVIGTITATSNNAGVVHSTPVFLFPVDCRDR